MSSADKMKEAQKGNCSAHSLAKSFAKYVVKILTSACLMPDVFS